MENEMIIEKNGKEITIYPLFKIERNQKIFLIYTTETDTSKIKENMYVGELIENDLCPISDELLESFEQLIEEVMDKIEEKLKKEDL